LGKIRTSVPVWRSLPLLCHHWKAVLPAVAAMRTVCSVGSQFCAQTGLGVLIWVTMFQFCAQTRLGVLMWVTMF